ncbi:MAG: DUF2937 family protein [Bacteroidia bacterium]|nr:DUF2937 family protein [Bacteroidia bacterium]
MAFLKRILGWFGSVLDRILCILAAVAFAQGPVYMAQYTDVLSGAKLEAGKSYEALSQEAARFNLSLPQYLDELLRNENPMVRGNAELDAALVKRYEGYTRALEAIQRASVWERPFALARHFDRSIHDAVQFEPGIPFSWEGLAYALAGLIAMMLLLALLGRAGRLFRRRKPATA